MEKNTIWALVLSGLVFAGAIVVETMVIMPKQQAAQLQRQQEEQMLAEQMEAEVQEHNSLISTQFEEVEEAENVVEEIEQYYSIKTNKVLVKFTNKGGDIISYQLLDHKDKDTNAGVEMADSITSTNKAFSVALGNEKADIMNDVFNVKVIDDYTIGFYRDYFIKNAAGESEKVRVSKLYTFKEDDYVFKLDIGMESEAGVDFDGIAYTLRTSPQIGPHYDKKTDRYEVRQYISFGNNKKIKKEITNKVYDKPYEWAGVAGKYFAMIVKPADNSVMSRKVNCSVKSDTDYANAQVLLSRVGFKNTSAIDSYYVYVGPRSESELIKYNSSDKNDWGLVNVKFNQALQTSGMLSFIEVALKWCVEMIYRLVKNWGVAIIVFTILLRIILFPLNKKSAVGSVKMQEIQPKLQALQEKYANDRQKLAEESQKLYKESGYNPASGCLPMIIQMIVLLSMFNVFNNYFEFRGASFIPGWIDDLSVGDSILTWNKNIWLISDLTRNTLRLLPFIYLASQMLNGVITQFGGATAGQTKGQMAFLMYGMPLMFFFICYNMPSGLLLYWTVSNILQIGQQMVINQITKRKKSELEKNKPVINKNEAKFNGGKKKTR